MFRSRFHQELSPKSREKTIKIQMQWLAKHQKSHKHLTKTTILALQSSKKLLKSFNFSSKAISSVRDLKAQYPKGILVRARVLIQAIKTLEGFSKNACSCFKKLTS